MFTLKTQVKAAQIFCWPWHWHRGVCIASVGTTPILAPGCSTPLPVGKIVWFPGSPAEFYLLPSGANLSPFSSPTAKPRLWHRLGKCLCSLNQDLVAKGMVMRDGTEIPNQKLLRKGRSGNDRSWFHNRWARENAWWHPVLAVQFCKQGRL